MFMNEAALSLELWRYQRIEDISEGLLIGSGFCDSVTGYLGVIYLIFICTFGLFALHRSWVTIMEMFISRGTEERTEWSGCTLGCVARITAYHLLFPTGF